MRSGLRPSACPGLFRIVTARDGGICRLRVPLGHLAAGQARAIGEVARRFGNGIVDATNRANLQIRGIEADKESALVAHLLDAGLGPERLETDDIRNVMVSPMAGLDPAQEMDVLPLARAILANLESVAEYRDLSPKFSLLVDGGEAVAATGHPHDIWLAGITGGRSIAMGIAGSPPATPHDPTPFLLIAPHRAATAVAAALTLFRAMAAGNPAVTRLRHLLVRMPREDFLAVLAARLDGATCTRSAALGWHRRSSASRGHVGLHPQRQEGMTMAGAAVPLGRLSPKALGDLADIADAFGDGHLRLTPRRSILVTSIPARRGPAALEALERAGMITDPANPLAGLIACSGLTGCPAALADTKADAVALARLLASDDGRSIHLSGCGKSCASPVAEDITLVAAATGRYDLFLRDPAGESRFGTMRGRNLDLIEIAARLRD